MPRDYFAQFTWKKSTKKKKRIKEENSGKQYIPHWTEKRS